MSYKRRFRTFRHSCWTSLFAVLRCMDAERTVALSAWSVGLPGRLVESFRIIRRGRSVIPYGVHPQMIETYALAWMPFACSCCSACCEGQHQRHSTLPSSNDEPTTANTHKPRKPACRYVRKSSASFQRSLHGHLGRTSVLPFFARRAHGATTLRSLRRRSNFCCSSDCVPQPLPQTGASRSKAEIAACGEQNHFGGIEETLRSHSRC